MKTQESNWAEVKNFAICKRLWHGLCPWPWIIQNWVAFTENFFFSSSAKGAEDLKLRDKLVSFRALLSGLIWPRGMLCKKTDINGNIPANNSITAHYKGQNNNTEGFAEVNKGSGLGVCKGRCRPCILSGEMKAGHCRESWRRAERHHLKPSSELILCLSFSHVKEKNVLNQ